MRQITFVTTTANCDDTFDKITHLNEGFKADHFKKDLIILRGNFAPDIFVWTDEDKGFGEGTWWRYCLTQDHKEINEERYDNMLNVMPPVYITHIDGNPVKEGFGVGEAYSEFNNTVVLTTCYKKEGKYYECFCVMYKHNYKPIIETYSAEWTRDNYGITYQK